MKNNKSKMRCKRGFTKAVMLNSFQHLHLTQPLFKAEEALNKDVFRAPLRYGFTLIELLVVVLIIGILAAVALPQYQVAVMKSRFIQLQTAGDAFIKSYKIYRLATGEDPVNFEQLDILPLGNLSEDKLFVTNGDMYCRMYENAQEMDCRRTNTPHFVYYFPTSPTGQIKRDRRICRGFDETQKKVCLSMGGIFANAASRGYTDYVLP